MKKETPFIETVWHEVPPRKRVLKVILLKGAKRVAVRFEFAQPEKEMNPKKKRNV